MLILAREPNETVVLTVGGHRVLCTVVSIDKKRRFARLGFTAPPEVQIHRREIQIELDRNKEKEKEKESEEAN